MWSHDFDDSMLTQTVHRPWDMPQRPWLMRQTWHDLLFAHWPMPAEDLRDLIPPVFELDLFANQAWLAIVPFRMANVAPRSLPSVPWVSAFDEINVRTYVRVGDKPGVFFFSLDAASTLAVRTARMLFNLPYHSAVMQVIPRADGLSYVSRRKGARPSAEFVATYGPAGPASAPPPGSLEYFLTERYCLYHLNHQDEPYRLEIHHAPWALQPGWASVAVNTMADASGLALPSREPLLHFAKRQDVVAFAPTTLRDGDD